MSKSPNHETVWLIMCAALIGGLLAAFTFTWIMDFNFERGFEVAVGMAGVAGGLIGTLIGAILALAQRDDRKRG